MSFLNFYGNSGSPISTKKTEELEDEIERRQHSNQIFPLWVFNEKVQPFIDVLNNKYDIPRAYIGLSMLTAYSTAIGTAYAVAPNGVERTYMALWSCLVGISSSGKTLAIDKTFNQLWKIQDDFDQQWKEDTVDLELSEINRMQMHTAMIRDVHVATVVRSVMPDNPKGICKHADEILEWINGMNQLSKKEGTDEQFWLSSWNATRYSGIRSGKQKFTIARPFINVIGGIQPSILYKLFAKDRDTTGFVFRMLFAQPEFTKIATPDPLFGMPSEIAELHDYCISHLYNELDVRDELETPKLVQFTAEGNKEFQAWEKDKIGKINAMKNDLDKEIHASILGKMKDYARRFIGILCVVDKAYTHHIANPYHDFPSDLYATTDVVKRGLEIADYFYASAVEVYEDVRTRVIAPPEVLMASNLFNSGYSYEKIAIALWDDKKAKSKAHRKIQQWIIEYPKQFRAAAR